MWVASRSRNHRSWLMMTAQPAKSSSAVIISHDRWFLDRVCTHILAFEGDSQAVWFEGNYQDYEADKHRRLGTAADQPHRIKYKPLKVA